MNVGSTRHRNSIFVILEAVGRLVLYRGARLLLDHAWFESASLDHEAVNNTMKYCIVIVSASHVVLEILNRQGSLFTIEFERDIAKIRMQFNHVCPYFEGWDVGSAAPLDISLASSITTASLGTSLGKGPLAPVERAAILFTTSIPLVTFPNTVYP